MERRTAGGRAMRRASSSSACSSPEVRCACQYYDSVSPLPERTARLAAAAAVGITGRLHQHQQYLTGGGRAKTMVQSPPAGARRTHPVRCDHDYEPIGDPNLLSMRMALSQPSIRLIAPVVKITDTDVIAPVADSDDSIDDRYRFKSRSMVLEGDVVLPLDGKIEDNAMDSRNLGDQTIDTLTGDEIDTDHVEHRFLREDDCIKDAHILYNRPSLTDSTSPRVNIQQKLKTQAGKIKTRLKGIQKPSFTLPRRSKDKPKPQPQAEQPKTQASPPSSPHQKASRMERFRMALPERPRFSMPDKSKFHLPDKSKFHIKKPNIQLPKSLHRPKRTSSMRVGQAKDQVEPAEPKPASKRNIFDFSTYPRPKLFDRKPKEPKVDYVTSSPKESRAQSTESSTFPRSKKTSLSARWAQRFNETTRIFHHADDTITPPVDRSTPWRHPSLEEPRLSLKPMVSMEGEEKLPWEDDRRYDEVAPDEDQRRYDSVAPDLEQRTLQRETHFPFEKETPVKDPRQYDEQLMERIESESVPKKSVRMVQREDAIVVEPEAEEVERNYRTQEDYDSSFPPVDPRDFRNAPRPHSIEVSEEEEESMRSDREIQQSSGSSCERRRRGVIEEIDSDEFFLREKGISQEHMRYNLISEIRDALNERNALVEDEPPVRPKRTRSTRKRREESLESYDTTDKAPTQRDSFERGGSLSSHRIIYHTESSQSRDHEDQISEPLDDIIVVKPMRKKSKSGSLRSQSQSLLPPEEQNIVLAPLHADLHQQPAAPSRRKRLRRDQSSSLSIRTNDSAICNGYIDTNGSLPHSHERIPPTPPPTPPPFDEDELDYIVPAASTPVAPKRTRSHSRTGSLAPEDDRTSHGAESLPGDFGYVDEDLPPASRDYSSTSREPSLPGYAVIEKREKPPRPPPPRRKRQEKFATTPRPFKSGGPKRPIRGYSTLRPAKSDTIGKSTESFPFMDGSTDYSVDQPVEEDFHKDLRSGEILSKMQGRPLPAPPRPPRHRKLQGRRSLPREITPDVSETVASTQTDPLPDDLVIEEEVMAAKLVVSPSRSGSQILISTERMPSPTSGSYKSLASTPPVPPLPSSRDALDRLHDDDLDGGHEPVDHRVSSSEVPTRRVFDQAQLDMLRAALFSTDEPLRIPSLEVGDLKVDRLTVSQLEAYKVAASEIDAIVVSATEMSGRSETEGGIHPSLLQELIAIKNQLEAVAAVSQPASRPQSSMEDACTATSNERISELDRLSSSDRRRMTMDRRSPATRESSPLLIVQPSLSEIEATDEQGRTLFYPLSASMTDLTSTASDNITSSDATATTVILAETIEDPVIKIVEPPSEQTSTPPPPTSSDEPRQQRQLSRSRSGSPTRTASPGAVRQTASPVKSLPPVISVTPDSIITSHEDATASPAVAMSHVTSSHGIQPQRAVISYRTSEEAAKVASSSPPLPRHKSSSRETSQSPPLPRRQSLTTPEPTKAESGRAQFIAFPTSQIPPEFFALASHPPAPATASPPPSVEVEPSIADVAAQLFRALGQAGNRTLRNFVDYLVSRFVADHEDRHQGGSSLNLGEEKIRRIELAVCALLVVIAGLILMFICNPRTVTHHHHWDYFNPPQ